MQKLLYITPHLSTGGAPQYLLKKIELLKDKYEIFLVEYTNLGGTAFVIQKNKIFDIIPSKKRITLGEDKTQLLDFLDLIQPDIVHLEEIPELFMDREITEILYNKNRKYTIFETSHDSSQNPNNKQFFPDKFMFVSNWQIDQYKNIDVPSVLVEYPIEYKENRNRVSACKRLKLDPNKKHIIHVGLFTPRKNQSEFFEYARLFPEYEFHCIGNQASNFENYWGPLMKNKPDNLTWWGERNDVDNFYEAADLFLFTSRGNPHDKETMPLVIREALSWKLPILIYNLEVYQNYFDSYPVTYLTDKEQNIKNIKNMVGEFIEIKDLSHSPEDFNITFDGYNKFTFEYQKEKYCKYKIVVQEKHSNAPLYWFKPEFSNKSIYWCVPNQGWDMSKSWIKDLTFNFYSLDDKFLFFKELQIKETGLEPNVKLELANPFDCLFHNYAEIFVDKKYDFLFESKLNTVLDIGANAGTFSKLFLEKGVDKVYAFEPNQEALLNLNHLSSINSNLKVFEKAIHFVEQDLTFYIDPDNTTIGSSDPTHVNYDKSNKIQKIIVPTITLKNFIKQEKLNKIDLIKIDIEGAEYDVIENLENEVFDIVDRFLIEWHDNTDTGKLESMVSLLESKGYSITKAFDQNTSEDLKNNFKNKQLGTLLAEKLPPKVTVVIPTYNHENYIEQCVDSVLSQKTSFEYNIIISDDCSTDNTWEKLQQYKDISNVTLHQPSKNIGPYFKRFKELYDLTDSTYITLIDGDDFYTNPNKLQSQVDFLDNNPDYILHSVGFHYVDHHGGIDYRKRYGAKSHIHSYKECLEGNHVSFGPMWRNIFNYDLIDLYPTNDNRDIRWGEFMMYLQKGKCYNDKETGGCYRILPKTSEFTSKSHEEKIEFTNKVASWNNQYISNDVIIIDAYIHDSSCLKKLKQSSNNLKSLGLPLMLVTNSKLDSTLTDVFDYIIYDNNNRLAVESYNDVDSIRLFNHRSDCKFEAFTKSTQKHGLSVLSNLYTSTNFAKSLGFTNFYRIEYDAVIEMPLNLIKESIKCKAENKKGFVYINENKYIGFQVWYMDLDLFTSIFPQINSEYDFKQSISTISNKDFLSAEEFVYNLFSTHKKLDLLSCKDPTLQSTDYGNKSLWNTIITPAESSLIQEGYIALPYKVKNNKNQIALITWNISKEGITNNTFNVATKNSTFQINHTIEGKDAYKVDIITLSSSDTIITTRSDSFTLNTNNINQLPHFYEDLSD